MPTVVQQRTLAARPADWSDSVTLDQIDPASGIESVTLGLAGTLSSTVSVYSLEGAASTFSSDDVALVQLGRPSGTTLLSAGPSTDVSMLLPAATGSAAQDFALPATAADSASVTYTAGGAASADAALLIGTGTITLPVDATARVMASAPGNFGAVFGSEVGATVSVTAATGGQTGGGTLGNVTTVMNAYPPPVLDAGDITGPRQHVQVASATTGWSQALGIAGFDPTLGTLQAVTLTIGTTGTAKLQAENLDSESAYLGVKQAATVEVGAGGTVLDSEAATVTTDRTLYSFDGTIDDAGASGETLQNSASATATTVLSDPASLAAFTGAAAAGLTLSDVGQTSIDGPGALSISAALQAGAGVDVTYTYDPTAGLLFDSNYYLAENPDVAAAGVDPYQHYIDDGWHEGRNPDQYFDTNYYLAQNPDVAASGMDPLLHYQLFGWKEGRDPSLLFSTVANETTRNTFGNTVSIVGDPLLAYIESHPPGDSIRAFPASDPDQSGGFSAPDSLVDTAFYDRQLGATLLPTGISGAGQAAWSYDAMGWEKGLDPDGWFNTGYYLAHNPDVAAAHINPLVHYETYGWKEGRDPSALFSTDKYLAAYADVRAAGIDPLLHYVVFGQAEGRTAFSV